MSQKTYPVSVRFSLDELLLIDKKVEETRTTRTRLLRTAWQYYSDGLRVEQQLLALEDRLSQIVFDVCSEVVRITPDERHICAAKLNERLAREVFNA